MSRRNYVIAAVSAMLTLSIMAVPQHAWAQDAKVDDSDSPFGIGFHSSWPTYGISGVYDMNERITLQAIVGALGTVTNFGGRGLYRFQLEDKYDVFGYGAVGLLRYSAGRESESALGFGGGGGVELDWRRILSPEDNSFPPLFSTIEIGLTVNTFDTYGDLSILSIGGSIHYRF